MLREVTLSSQTSRIKGKRWQRAFARTTVTYHSPGFRQVARLRCQLDGMERSDVKKLQVQGTLEVQGFDAVLSRALRMGISERRQDEDRRSDRLVFSMKDVIPSSQEVWEELIMNVVVF